MSWIGSIGAIVAVLAALLVAFAAAVWAHLWYWVKRLSLRLDYIDEEVLRTADGSAIEIRRIARPALADTKEGAALATSASSLPPVLLVHGICANHRNQDIHPDYSLARYLAAIGRDVWLLTLRSGRAARRGDRVPARFAAMAENDIPLAVSTILERTGRTSLDYVGFSMGGMLLYASLGALLPERAVRRAVVVGSPGRIEPALPVPRIVARIPVSLIPGVPARFGARAFAFLSEWLTTPLHRLIMNPSNVAAGITRLALIDCIEDVPGPLLADFLGWAATDGEIRVGGERILGRLARVRIPALFVAGSTDRIAPQSAVKAAFEAWASDMPDVPKRFVVLGRDYGAHEDYGHGDLALGARVGLELFEPIARFLGPEDLQTPESPGPETGPAARDEIDARAPLPEVPALETEAGAAAVESAAVREAGAAAAGSGSPARETSGS